MKIWNKKGLIRSAYQPFFRKIPCLIRDTLHECKAPEHLLLGPVHNLDAEQESGHH